MCGIVGYLGSSDPKKIILDGLGALEYRGYDSAGVAILDHGKFHRVRAEGKLQALSDKIMNTNFSGHLGIGHTRWATHGPPSERNAHPHCSGGVHLVHNGIIENYADLRAGLISKGVKIESDTDSEIVVHLIALEVQAGKDLKSAVLSVLPQLKGAYSVLVVNQDQPDEMVAFKNGPPLIVGGLVDGAIVASDIQAIVAHTRNVFYLEDFEVAHVRGARIEFFDRHGSPTAKSAVTIDWNAEKAERMGFSHFMLKEIFEQPRAVAQAMSTHLSIEDLTVKLTGLGLSESAMAELDQVERLMIVACGTSFYAAMAGKYLIEKIARIPVDIDIASEFRYRGPILSPHTLGVVISQSGETADTLAALRLMKEMNVPTLSVCNVRRSSIDREADGHLYMNAGPEVGVASTKALSCTLVLMNILALALGKIKGRLKSDEEASCVRALLALPSQMETVLVHDKFFAEAARVLSSFKGFLYMGRGVSYPMAMEGALKLKELAYMHAEGYAAGEMKHGPLALIDERMAVVMLAPSDEVLEKTVSNLEEVRARGGQIITIGTGENAHLRELSRYYLAIPEAHWTVNPILELLPLQLLAFHVADHLGHDVDRPRNLAKSVTVE